jgi:hypothetical protein
MVDFYVMCQIMDYPSKLMENCSMTLGLFMTYHDQI